MHGSETFRFHRLHRRTIRGGGRRGAAAPPPPSPSFGKLTIYFGQKANDSGNSTWEKTKTKRRKTNQRLPQCQKELHNFYDSLPHVCVSRSITGSVSTVFFAYNFGASNSVTEAGESKLSIVSLLRYVF